MSGGDSATGFSPPSSLFFYRGKTQLGWLKEICKLIIGIQIRALFPLEAEDCDSVETVANE